MRRKKNKTERRRRVSSIAFLLTGILIISLSLMLSNCGKAKQKSIIADGGSFAIDLSLASSGKMGMVVIVNPNKSQPSLNQTQLTVEAWVKSTSNPSGVIFNRYSADSGIALYSATSTARFVLRIPASGTATDYIVDSAVNINDGAWHHIAAVLVNADHSTTTPSPNHATSTSCTTAVMAETPHLDIYVAGTFRNCATTASLYATSTHAVDTAFMGRATAPIDGVYVTTTRSRFDGKIDEVRLYKIAKTSAEINATMNRELNNVEIASDNLLNYWRNNVGKGKITVDYTGNSFNGTIFQCNPDTIPPNSSCIEWEDSWAAGDWK